MPKTKPQKFSSKCMLFRNNVRVVNFVNKDLSFDCYHQNWNHTFPNLHELINSYNESHTTKILLLNELQTSTQGLIMLALALNLHSHEGDLTTSLDKRPMGLNSHLSVRDSTLTSCQKGRIFAYHCNSPIIE